MRAGATVRIVLVTARKEAPQQCTITATRLRHVFAIGEAQTAHIVVKLNRHLPRSSYRIRIRCSGRPKQHYDVRVKVPRRWRGNRRAKPVRAVRVTVRDRVPADCQRLASGDCDDPPPTLAEHLQEISPRVRTWTDAFPVDLTTGRVALVHYWGGCPTCYGDPGYDGIQAWADAHPDVRVVAVSCLDSWNEDWLSAHPSWRRPDGFPILVRDTGGTGDFTTCVHQFFAQFGLRDFYATQSFLENGVGVGVPEWAAGWPTELYAEWSP